MTNRRTTTENRSEHPTEHLETPVFYGLPTRER